MKPEAPKKPVIFFSGKGRLYLIIALIFLRVAVSFDN